MQYIKPDYYDKFQCLASDCPDTCCSEWNIQIDDASMDLYKCQKGPFGEKLNDAIDWSEDVFKQEGHFCKLLDENHLCSICTELGADAMCETCRDYPRHTEEYYNYRELSLSMSCPEAARMILTHDSRKFLYENDDLKDSEEDFEDFDQKMFNELTECRYMIYQFIDTCHFGLDYTISSVLHMVKEIERTHQDGSIEIPGILYTAAAEHEYTRLYEYHKLKQEFSCFYELDIQRANWEEVLNDTWQALFEVPEETYVQLQKEFRYYLTHDCELKWQDIFCNIFLYFIYNYLLGAVYDDRIYAKASFAIFSTMWLKTFVLARWAGNGKNISLDDIIEIAYRYAREVEHSDYNLDVLEDFCEQI